MRRTQESERAVVAEKYAAKSAIVADLQPTALYALASAEHLGRPNRHGFRDILTYHTYPATQSQRQAVADGRRP